MKLHSTNSLAFIVFVFTILWSPICKSQSSLIHEVKPAFLATYYFENLGLLYEIIPGERWGYELGVVSFKNVFMYSCPDGYCDSPDENENLIPHYIRSWAFNLSLKYYLSKELQASRWYLGASLLYAVEVPSSISDELRAKFKDDHRSPINSYLSTSQNHISPSGMVGYKWRLGQHLLLEPSISMGIDLSNISSGMEYLFTGRVGWRF